MKSYFELSDADKQAIDLLLDGPTHLGRVHPRALSTAPADHPTADPASSEDSQSPADHLGRWRRVLSRLDHFEVPEPPPDLVDRTLMRIEQAPYAGPSDVPDLDSHLSPNLSH